MNEGKSLSELAAMVDEFGETIIDDLTKGMPPERLLDFGQQLPTPESIHVFNADWRQARIICGLATWAWIKLGLPTDEAASPGRIGRVAGSDSREGSETPTRQNES